MPDLHQARIPGRASDDTRSVMARASDGRLSRYYDPARAHAEPPAVTAARERHRALNEAIAARLRELQAAQGGAP